MKKSILAIAVASMAASSAALADPTVYGNIHISLNFADNDIPNADNNPKLGSNTSALGVKGSEDLGDGLKAIYKAEFEIDIASNPATAPDAGNPAASGSGLLTGRDQFVGLKGGWGTLKVGTMSTNYKQMGGKVDPLYRTPLEGRSNLMQVQSKLHSGRGNINGRETNTMQYVTPKMAGIQLVANTTFSGNNDETSGIGLRWSNKALMLYVDYITGPTADVHTCDTASSCSTEAATKIGGKFDTDAFSLSLQYEDAQDRIGADYLFANGTFNINKNNMLSLTYGMQDRLEAAGAPDNDSTSVGLAYNHKMSKMTNVYVGYGARSEDAASSDESMLVFGIRKKF